MKENKIEVIIKRSVWNVFDFTTNPKMTHLWIPLINEEIAEPFPPVIGTQYKNRGKTDNWNFYKVIEYSRPKIFTLADLKEEYFVRYLYNSLGKEQSQLIYFEWMKKGELSNPFAQDILDNLKRVMER
jgi:hypothetical protein